uniref:Uncharacterized protein n=1 Tax=Compsopogon caeruleus TaxID=31354 RepID=A0A7S1TJU9_9RHOD|mmetsp:Transcript_7974/g.16013  ORF Transcript_7974/g.16013 Transcript_7974/m.16013 type:complete len:358 (+) Transcript_7974:770-1843(+)
MIRLLKKAGHDDVRYHEEPGKGHWYSSELDDGGSHCVDWPPLFDFFASRHVRAIHEVLQIDFSTLCPAYSDSYAWIRIYSQLQHMLCSRIRASCLPNKRIIFVETINVQVFQLRTRSILEGQEPTKLLIDGDTIVLSVVEDAFIRRTGTTWQRVETPSPWEKGPHRYGPLKMELRNNLLAIVPSDFRSELARMAIQKATLDREQCIYRAQAFLEIVTDVEFTQGKIRADGRSLLIYGNENCNSAWSTVLGSHCPLRVSRSCIELANEVIISSPRGLALFLYPRVDCPRSSVICVGASGPEGMRLAFRQPLFQPFVRYPDFSILESSNDGKDPARMVAAGYFSTIWDLVGVGAEIERL